MLVLRLIVSSIAAFAVVVTLMAVAISIFYDGRDEERIVHHPVDLLTGVERVEVGELLGEDWDPDRRRLPQRIEAPPTVLPPRSVSGFVQLEFEVDSKGRVGDVDIVGATPQGYFEEQARAIVESRTYAPTLENGRPVASRRSELVDFTVAVDPDTPPPTADR